MRPVRVAGVMAVVASVGVAATASGARVSRRRAPDWPWTGWSGRLPAALADRVLAGGPRTAGLPSAQAASAATVLRTPDGYAVRVVLSRAYRPSRRIEQAYVDFLGSLLHGPELGQLHGLVIDTPAQVASACGAGALACYAVGQETMIVPGKPPFPGAPVAYVLAHEYAHHIAAHRLSALGPAERYGPEHWDAHEHVCAGVRSGRLKPGAQRLPAYFENPGEAWAEAYAQVSFPHAEPWRFDRRLAPRAGTAAAIRADVLHPWDGAHRVLSRRSRLSAAAGSLRTRALRPLAGIARIAVHAPRSLAWTLTLSAGAGRLWTRSGRGSRAFAPLICAAGRAVRVRVRRRAGSGELRLRLRVPVPR